MKCCEFVVLTLLGFALQANGKIDTEYRNLYCIDPITGVHYPVYSIWPSSNFCGTYTCSVRVIGDDGNSFKNMKETYLEENMDEEDNEDQEESIQLGNSFTYVNFSDPEETVKIYKAAKNLLDALESKVHLKNSKRQEIEIISHKLVGEKNNKASQKTLTHLSAKRLELLFDAANDLVFQLEKNLKNNEELSEAAVEDMEKLLKVSHKISDLTEKEMSDKSKTEIPEFPLQRDPKFMEYLDEYNKYMEEYREVYEKYMTKSNAKSSCACNVVQTLRAEINKVNDNEVSPSEISQMFYYADDSGFVKQIAVPKHIENITIPGVLADSDSEFNYWNLTTKNIEKCAVEKIDLSDFEIQGKTDKNHNLVKRHTSDLCSAASDQYFKSLNLLNIGNAKSSNENTDECPFAKMMGSHNLNNYNADDSDEIVDDGVLMKKFEKAMIAYAEFFTYFNTKLFNDTNTDCFDAQSHLVEAKVETKNKAIKDTTSTATNVNNDLSTEKTKTTTEVISKEASLVLPRKAEEISAVVKDSKLEETTKSSNDDLKSTTTGFFDFVKSFVTGTSTDASVNKDNDTTTEDKDELLSKLSYYTFDNKTNKYVLKTPKDEEEYEKYLNEYYEVMNITRPLNEETEDIENSDSTMAAELKEETSTVATIARDETLKPNNEDSEPAGTFFNVENAGLLNFARNIPPINIRPKFDSMRNNLPKLGNNILPNLGKIDPIGNNIENNIRPLQSRILSGLGRLRNFNIPRPMAVEKEILLKLDHGFQREGNEESAGTTTKSPTTTSSTAPATTQRPKTTTTSPKPTTTSSKATTTSPVPTTTQANRPADRIKPPRVSYYNYNPNTGKYVYVTPKNNDEYKQFLKEYEEVKKYYSDMALQSSNVQEVIEKLPEKTTVNRSEHLEDDFNAFVHLEGNSTPVDQTVTKQDDVLLKLKDIQSELSSSSDKDHPSLTKRVKRSLQSTGTGQRTKRWEAYITVKGCPETVEPGYFKNGDEGAFFPGCCPLKITN